MSTHFHFKIMFMGCQDSVRFSEKLQRCNFTFSRCRAKQVHIIGSDVHFAFTTDQPMTKNEIQKKCAQTFRKYDPFQSSVVEVLTEAQAPPLDYIPWVNHTTTIEAPPMESIEEAPAMVPLETLWR